MSQKLCILLLIVLLYDAALPQTTMTPSVTALTTTVTQQQKPTTMRTTSVEDEDLDEEDDEDDLSGGEADDDVKAYRFKNPRNSPSPLCPRNEQQASLFGQKCLRKCSADDDCKSKKKKCLCDGACGMSCIKPDRECPELREVERGTVTMTGRLFGDRATYTCQHGYHVVGLAARSCQADGQWAGSAPACKQNIYCLSPPTIDNARHNALPEQATFDLDSTLQYFCNIGYETNGFPRAKCLAMDGTANWYGPDITCEPKSCGPPEEVSHGWHAGDCYTYGCRVQYHCSDGFELVGRRERVCEADGRWVPRDLPTCVLVTAVVCPPPEQPRHGKAIYTSCSYNSVVSYECKYGYTLVGDATRRCGADRKWTGSTPACKEINCGHPGRLWNGWLENIEGGTGLGASIIFRCHEGMKLEGHTSTVCQIDGKWRYQLPNCSAPCVVPHVQQGKVYLITHENDTESRATIQHPTVVQHGEQLGVECQPHYEFLNDQNPTVCNNGTWINMPSSCEPARCKHMPKSPRNGMVIAPKTDHGMKAIFKCKDGYTLKGQYYVECSYGNWTGVIPYCEEVYCPFPGFVENGKVLLVGNMGLYDYRPYVRKVINNKQIMYECDKGYVLEGPPGATCIGGRWSPKELPRCVPGQHPRIRWNRRRRSAIIKNKLMKYLKAQAEISKRSKRSVDPEIDRRHYVFDRSKRLLEKYINNENARKLVSDTKIESFLTSLKDTHFNRIKKSATVPKNLFMGQPLVELNNQRLIRKNVDENILGNEEESISFRQKRSAELIHTTGFSKNHTLNKKMKPKDKRALLSKTSSQTSNQLLNRNNQNSGTSVRRGDRNRDNDDDSITEQPLLRTSEPKERKHRKKGPCEIIPSEPFINIEILKYGRDPNVTYSSGTIISVTCGLGYGLNINPNSTAKCVRGIWKPAKPECSILPCHVPITSNGFYKLAITDTFLIGTSQSNVLSDESTGILNDTIDVANGLVVKFSCVQGYNVKGPTNLKCWHGEWAVTNMPDCTPAPCQLPPIPNGQYLSGYRAGLTIGNGSFVTYQCDVFYRKIVTQPIQCRLGELYPRVPVCRIARPTLSGAGILSGINRTNEEDILYRAGSDISQNGGLDLLEKNNAKPCGKPARVQGAVLSREGEQITDENEEETYAEGTEITFDCENTIIGEKNTWRMICEDGSWIGKTFACEEEDLAILSPTLLSNETCVFRNNEPNVVSFYNDQEIRDTVVEFPPGSILVSRCTDIGKYAMVGSTHRRCLGPDWDGQKPACFGLNQENDYAMAKPPTILIRHQLGPIAQSNDGKLIVYPGTIVHMECLWMRRFGNPKWNVSQSYRKYPEGWSSDPGRDAQLEYRISIYHASKDDSGTFTCVTPARQAHSVVIEVKAIHCPQIPYRRGLEVNNKGTKMGTKLLLTCTNSNSLIGASEITCLPSGNWSNPFPICESVECGDVFGSLVAMEQPPQLRSVIVSREVAGRAVFSCAPGYGLRGPAETVCLSSGEWALPYPTCVEVQCEPPGIPENGYIQGTPPYKAGDIVQFNCNPDFMMEGQPIIACQDNSRWSGTLPKCVQACSYPGTTISGRMSAVKFYYKIGETITFSCDEGLILKGAPMLRCLKNGKWSNAIPTCVNSTSLLIKASDGDQENEKKQAISKTEQALFNY